MEPRRGRRALLDPEITYEDTILPDHVGETYRGHDGLARATKRWLEPYDELTIQLEQIVGTNDSLPICGERGRRRTADHEMEEAWTG
jgi:hypothetical protein